MRSFDLEKNCWFFLPASTQALNNIKELQAGVRRHWGVNTSTPPEESMEVIDEEVDDLEDLQTELRIITDSEEEVTLIIRSRNGCNECKQSNCWKLGINCFKYGTWRCYPKPRYGIFQQTRVFIRSRQTWSITIHDAICHKKMKTWRNLGDLLLNSKWVSVIKDF